MIDIHSHILPFVDDGAVDMNMSVKMAKIYLEQGIKMVVATPHYIEYSSNTTVEGNTKILKLLREELKKEDLDLEIFLGNEILSSMDIIRYVKDGITSTLNGTKYVLVELPMYDLPLYIESMIYDLLLNGYIPIIAHPERNSKIIEDPNILYRYIELGALSQLNLPSLEGKYGQDVKETAKILLENNMIHFVGTDAHSKRVRSPMVRDSLKILRDLVSKEYYDNLTFKNAELLLENKYINIKDPIEYEKDNKFTMLLKKIGIL